MILCMNRQVWQSFQMVSVHYFFFFSKFCQLCLDVPLVKSLLLTLLKSALPVSRQLKANLSWRTLHCSLLETIKLWQTARGKPSEGLQGLLLKGKPLAESSSECFRKGLLTIETLHLARLWNLLQLHPALKCMHFCRRCFRACVVEHVQL